VRLSLFTISLLFSATTFLTAFWSLNPTYKRQRCCTSEHDKLIGACLFNAAAY